MKALTLWRPWPWAIFHLPTGLGIEPKRIENRPWPPPPEVCLQRIALHSGKAFDYRGAEFIADILRQHNAPAEMVALVLDETKHLAGVIEGATTIRGSIRWWGLPELEVVGGQPPPGQRVWSFGPYCWLLEDVHRLARPVECRGMQKLWEVPQAVLQQIERQLLKFQVPEDQ